MQSVSDTTTPCSGGDGRTCERHSENGGQQRAGQPRLAPVADASMPQIRAGRGLAQGAAWLTSVRPRRADLKSDILAALPGAISSVGDGMAASVLAGVKPVHGL